MKMGTISILLILCFLCFPFIQHLNAETIVVDALSEWSKPSVHVGDSIIFKHKSPYGLHVFNSKRAFDLCNFLLATLLHDNNNNSFMWKPMRPGYYYYSYGKGTSPGICRRGEKLAIRVIKQKLPEEVEGPSPAAAPPPESGGTFRSSPAHQWRTAAAPASPPIGSPVSSGGGIPFITSNPAVPLPTGETDTAVIRPLPTSGCLGAYYHVGFSLQVCIWLVLLLWGELFHV